MIERMGLMNGWLFSPEWQDGMERRAEGHSFVPVSLPHAAAELPLNYFDERSYQKVSCYRTTLPAFSLSGGRRAILRFEGVMAAATVWVNGRLLGEHKGGYTPFEFDATDRCRGDGSDELTVRADARERPDVPPFGGQIDYLTYSGIYREVYLDLSAPLRIRNVRAECASPLAAEKSLTLRVFAANAGGAARGTAEASLLDPSGRVVASVSAPVTVSAGESEFSLELTRLGGLFLWSPDSPTLYTAVCSLKGDCPGEPADTFTFRYGFRTAEFRPDGFYLNGERLKIVGLNRHQAWPYVGYAMPARSQRRDADILKYELRVNLARTSHYPQSPRFLDRCDEIGLLVFEEIPGWQHIGDDDWKALATENVREMVERDWNRPSVVLWGVRINESQDDDAFYARNNALAHSLDRSRQTGGVRYLERSRLLEDVYTMNDFSLDGGAVALRSQRAVTGLDHDVPYLVTEYNGHMYPTKKTDSEERQIEHVIRHLRVQDASFGDPLIAGAVGWCAFDYNTHKDFGSGDRICHHGVMDIFRIPKFASYVYASQTPPSRGVVLKPVTRWARGERSVGGILPLVVLTNCDSIGITFGANEEIRITERGGEYPNLPYPPFVVDSRHIPPEKVGAWGMVWEEGLITGYVGGEAAAVARFAGNPVGETLAAVADDRELAAGAKDATRVVVSVNDQAGNPLPYGDAVVSATIEGPARILGPSTFALIGGSRAFWVESSGTPGSVRVAVTAEGLDTRILEIDVR